MKQLTHVLLFKFFEKQNICIKSIKINILFNEVQIKKNLVLNEILRKSHLTNFFPKFTSSMYFSITRFSLPTT